MKHLTLLLCVLTLTGCSLTTQPSEPITNSGSTEPGTTLNNQSPIGIDLMSGEDLTLSGSTIFTGATSGDVADGVAYIQDNNVRVRSGAQLIQLTKNGGRTDLCDNGEPLEYLDPQINGNYLSLSIKCGQSKEEYMRDINQGESYQINTNISFNDQCFTTEEESAIKFFISKRFDNQFLKKENYCSRQEEYNGGIFEYPTAIQVRGYNGNSVLFNIHCGGMGGGTRQTELLYLQDNNTSSTNIIISDAFNLCVKGSQVGGLLKNSEQETLGIYDMKDNKLIKTIVSPNNKTFVKYSGMGDDKIDVTNSGNSLIINYSSLEEEKWRIDNINNRDTQKPQFESERVVLPLQ